MTLRLARDLLLAQVSEGTFQAQLVRQARAWGWRCFHDTVAWRSDAGWPDLVMVRRGRLVVAELKKMGGKLTPSQREWLMAWWESGKAEVYVWDPRCTLEIARVLAPDGVLVVS